MITTDEPCKWEREDEDSDIWLTNCGTAFTLNEGTPKENRMKFCCFCGRKIKTVKYNQRRG